MSIEWKCICGEWVDGRYLMHLHAKIKEGHDREGSFKTIGQPLEIWTYERESDRPTRRRPNACEQPDEVGGARE